MKKISCRRHFDVNIAPRRFVFDVEKELTSLESESAKETEGALNIPEFTDVEQLKNKYAGKFDILITAAEKELVNKDAKETAETSDSYKGFKSRVEAAKKAFLVNIDTLRTEKAKSEKEAVLSTAQALQEIAAVPEDLSVPTQEKAVEMAKNFLETFSNPNVVYQFPVTAAYTEKLQAAWNYGDKADVGADVNYGELDDYTPAGSSDAVRGILQAIYASNGETAAKAALEKMNEVSPQSEGKVKVDIDMLSNAVGVSKEDVHENTITWIKNGETRGFILGLLSVAKTDLKGDAINQYHDYVFAKLAALQPVMQKIYEMDNTNYLEQNHSLVMSHIKPPKEWEAGVPEIVTEKEDKKKEILALVGQYNTFKGLMSGFSRPAFEEAPNKVEGASLQELEVLESSLRKEFEGWGYAWYRDVLSDHKRIFTANSALLDFFDSTDKKIPAQLKQLAQSLRVEYRSSGVGNTLLGLKTTPVSIDECITLASQLNTVFKPNFDMQNNPKLATLSEAKKTLEEGKSVPQSVLKGIVGTAVGGGGRAYRPTPEPAARPAAVAPVAGGEVATPTPETESKVPEPIAKAVKEGIETVDSFIKNKKEGSEEKDRERLTQFWVGEELKKTDDWEKAKVGVKYEVEVAGKIYKVEKQPQ
ncbi:hypothetical protein KKA13_02570 [Patescibacteria group bacterium]|nr:hypothetical protein [Patescibacteria group bacterium]